MALTGIGNAFQIRHFETGKAPLAGGDDLDYLYHRMAALLRRMLVAWAAGA